MAVKFEPRGSITGDLTEAISYFKASNGVIITQGNAVTLVSGFVENLDGTVAQDLLGVASETVTGTSASVEVGIYCDPNILYYNDADDVLANGDIGKVYRTISGGNQIDQATGSASSAQQFILVKRDPDGDQDASKGLFKPYKTLLLFSD